MNHETVLHVVKLIRKDGKVYLELPDEFVDKKLKAVKLSGDLLIVATEERLREIIEKQVAYLLRRGVKKKILERNGPHMEKKVVNKRIQKNVDYWIFASDQEAAHFSTTHQIQIQKKEIVGVRSFDGKYYAMRADTFAYLLPKVLAALGDGATPEALAKRTGVDKTAIKVVLELAREQGIVYEAPGGVYKRAE